MAVAGIAGQGLACGGEGVGNSKSLGQNLGVTLLNLYVEAQFLWNADQDVDRLLDEYYTLFYGPAAAEMKSFVDYGEANWMYLDKNAEKLGQVFTLLEKAQAKGIPLGRAMIGGLKVPRG